MPSYLITGSSRGIGLGFATELLKDKNNVVIATARNTAGSLGLQELKEQYSSDRLHLVDMDVTKPDSIHAAGETASKLLPGGLDHLISNAGVSYDAFATFENLNIDDFKSELEFNLISPIYVIREFLPLVCKSETKKIMVVGSLLASLEMAGYMTGLANSYSVAKAGLNMLVRKWSGELKNDGIAIISLHPGWVGLTEVGNKITPWMEKYAPQTPNLTVETSATESIKVLNGITADDSGLYFNYDGSKLPW